MKREWDLLREQLIDIEEENNVLADLPVEPKWTDQTQEEYERQFNKYHTEEARIFGHLEMLIDNGYVEGITILRSAAGGDFSYGIHTPRLTMAGHDLLDTMRSASLWETIKSTAQSKGVELTFDAIKTIGVFALGKIIGTS